LAINGHDEPTGISSPKLKVFVRGGDFISEGLTQHKRKG